MSTASRPHRAPSGDDSGFAMIIAVVVASVALVIVTVILAQGVHLNTSTVRDRKLQQALQVAELGVDRAASTLSAELAAGVPPTTTASSVGAVPGGETQTKVTPITGGYQIDSIGWVPANDPNSVRRHIRVQYLPEPKFTYAIFSASGLFLKSIGGVRGDVFGALDVELWNGTEVYGSVTSANGKIRLDQGAKIFRKADGSGGDATSGGLDTTGSTQWAVRLDNNALVANDVRTRVGTAGTPCPGGANYNVINSNGGSIGGKVHQPPQASVVGVQPAGGSVASCEQRPSAGLLLPEYQGRDDLTTMSVAAFNAPSNHSLQGKYFIPASENEVIDLACKTITGDYTLVTSAVIRKSNTCGSTPTFSGPASSVITIISTNASKNTLADPAVDIENSLSLPTPSPALLLYSKGFCSLKNSVVAAGAVYCLGIDIFTNLSITYDARIERVLGFGSSKYVKANFRELPSTTPLP